ncbi:MAG: flagellar motor protein MotB [candidate division Zixibacteria bacterium]|nr:flagellar motor protein MotB [candidate division Zixibacteria bacterium]MDD5426192.1 flagellar motor protein MotB [candidate division Zixibacteria bacterium]
MAEEQPPIIIRRKKHGHGGNHGGAWKVAFADFMTAMMAFFLVMWLVGQSDEVKESVAGYFRDPGKFNQQGRSGVLKGSEHAIQSEKENIGLIKTPEKPDFMPSSEEKKQLTLAAKNILEELKKQRAFDRLKKNIKVQMTSEGLRIILNESEDSPAFFEPGSAKLLQKSAIILVTIAKELGQLTNHLVIEGHTDASFTAQSEYSNWELSADRANAARQLMEVSGLNKGQVREVRGYAEKFPMITNNPGDPRNRRVSILVLYEARERQYDQVEVGADLMAEL